MKLTIAQILTLTGGKLIQEATPEATVSGVSTLIEACNGEVSFLGNEKYFNDFLATKASVVLVPPQLPSQPEGVTLIEVADPSMAFNSLVEHFHESVNTFSAGISPHAFVDASAQLDPEKVEVAVGAVIEAGAVIGDGCRIGAGCVVGRNVQMGQNCLLHPRVTVRERCILGKNVTIQPGAVIGSDGFGFLLNKETGRYDTVSQVGIVVIEDHVDIGANTTIDRARFGRTIIGEGSKIDNLVQIAHNVVIGKHSVVVAQSGIAGSTKIGNYVTIAAQCGIAGHLNIGDKAILAAKTGVMSNLDGGQTYWGSPSSPFKDACRQFAALRKLPDAYKELKELQAKAEEIQEIIRQAQEGEV